MAFHEKSIFVQKTLNLNSFCGCILSFVCVGNVSHPTKYNNNKKLKMTLFGQLLLSFKYQTTINRENSEIEMKKTNSCAMIHSKKS